MTEQLLNPTDAIGSCRARAGDLEALRRQAGVDPVPLNACIKALREAAAMLSRMAAERAELITKRYNDGYSDAMQIAKEANPSLATAEFNGPASPRQILISALDHSAELSYVVVSGMGKDGVRCSWSACDPAQAVGLVTMAQQQLISAAVLAEGEG